MGLCTSKSTVTLDPTARTLSADQVSQAAGMGVGSEGTPNVDEGILMVQPIKGKADGEGGGGWMKTGGTVNHIAKGYLELGGKGGGGELEAQTSHEAEEEEEDEEGDEVEELINFSDSVGSLRSEFLE